MKDLHGTLAVKIIAPDAPGSMTFTAHVQSVGEATVVRNASPDPNIDYWLLIVIRNIKFICMSITVCK